MTILQPSQVFGNHLQSLIGLMIDEAARHGASYLPDALRPEFCRQLVTEAAQHEFERLTPKPGVPVAEDMELLKVPLTAGSPSLICRLGETLQWLTSQHVHYQTRQHNGGTTWVPNEAAVHRYYPGSQALTAHRDYKTDRLLVAVFTVYGGGRFDLLEAGYDNPKVTGGWDTVTGGLCLMRAPGLTAAADDRPWHRALAPDRDRREVVIYRQVEITH